MTPDGRELWQRGVLPRGQVRCDRPLHGHQCPWQLLGSALGRRRGWAAVLRTGGISRGRGLRGPQGEPACTQEGWLRRWDSHQPLAEQLLDAGHQAKPLFLVTQMQRKGCGEGSSAERGAWPRPLRTQPGGGRWRAQGISTQQSPAVADWA